MKTIAFNPHIMKVIIFTKIVIFNVIFITRLISWNFLGHNEKNSDIVSNIALSYAYAKLLISSLHGTGNGSSDWHETFR